MEQARQGSTYSPPCAPGAASILGGGAWGLDYGRASASDGALAAWRIPLGNMGLQASRRGAGAPFGDFSAKNRNPFRSCFPLILSFTISAFVCTNSGRKTPMLHEMATRSKSEKIDDFQVMVLCAARAHTRELAVLHAMLDFFNRNWRVGSAAMRVR